MPNIPNDAFPRAEFGLPIVFHFPPRQGEPEDTVLYPENNSNGKQRERMASPLILKALRFANGDNVPLILRLKTESLTGVDLRSGHQTLPLPRSTVTVAPKLATYAGSPLAKSTQGSAVEALLEFAKQHGFHEVTQ